MGLRGQDGLVQLEVDLIVMLEALKRIFVHVALLLIVILPSEWSHLIIELRQAGPMEGKAYVSDWKVGADLVGMNWGEAFDASFLEWVSSNWFVEFPIVVVGAVNWLEWN
jgi:hypothetical protein